MFVLVCDAGIDAHTTMLHTTNLPMLSTEAAHAATVPCSPDRVLNASRFEYDPALAGRYVR